MTFTQNAGMAGGMALSASMENQRERNRQKPLMAQTKGRGTKKAGRTTAPRPWRL